MSINKLFYFLSEKDDYIPMDGKSKELNVRKNWLISFFLMYLPVLILAFFTKDISEKVGLLLGLTVSSWITYHCAFKKRGTAWLTWIMIGIPLHEASEIFYEHRWGNLIEWNAIAWIIYFVCLAIEVYYWINCYQLRKINMLRKKNISLINFKNTPECLDCISKMENSTNLNELNDVWSRSVSNWPQWESHISFIYNKRREWLLENNQT